MKVFCPIHRQDSLVVRFMAVALTACALMLNGCGYSASTQPGGGGYQWGGLYRSDITTVAVPVFENRTFARGDEIALTQALVAQIESRTPYKVVPRSRADTVLEGEIVSASVGTVSSDVISSLPQEQVYVIVVDFRWKDLRSGRTLVERRRFEQTSTFYPTLGEGRVVGRQASAEALAADIVEELQADW